MGQNTERWRLQPAITISRTIFTILKTRNLQAHGSAKLAGYLVVIGDTAVWRGGCNFRRGSSEVTRRHDAGFSHAEAKDQVVAPQRDVVVAGARRAGLLCIDRTAAEGQDRGLELSLMMMNSERT